MQTVSKPSSAATIRNAADGRVSSPLKRYNVILGIHCLHKNLVKVKLLVLLTFSPGPPQKNEPMLLFSNNHSFILFIFAINIKFVMMPLQKCYFF